MDRDDLWCMSGDLRNAAVHEKREGANRVHRVCRLLSSLCPLERNKPVLFMEQVQHPHQLEYSGMGAGRCLSFPPVAKKGTLSSQVLWPVQP